MKKLIAVMIASLIACSAVSFAEEPDGGTQASKKVKGSKSNSSERAGAGEGEVGAAQDATPVKGSKSNSDNRSTVKSSKSNSSE